MRLQITTPLSVLVDDGTVSSLRAEDSTGSFGILPGHADFMTSLAIAVVSWRQADGSPRFCAVRGGILTVTAGREIAIATREGVVGDDLATLEDEVLAHFRSGIEAERVEHAEQTRLQLNAIRQIMRHLQGNRPGGGLFT
jgi:F-type H+-transporting ATPase subunit epsilon